MAGIRVGLDDKLYINTGNFAVPTWSEVKLVQDLTQNLEIDKAEVKARISVYLMTLPTFLKSPFEFTMLADTTDANYGLIRNSAINRSVIDMAIADGAIATAGTEYFRAEYYTYSFKRNQPIGEVNTVDVSLDLAASANNYGTAPAFTTVGS